jgi:hypothetical protein
LEVLTLSQCGGLEKWMDLKRVFRAIRKRLSLFLDIDGWFSSDNDQLSLSFPAHLEGHGVILEDAEESVEDDLFMYLGCQGPWTNDLEEWIFS